MAWLAVGIKLLLGFVVSGHAVSSSTFINCTRAYRASPLEQRWVTNISKWETQDRNWHTGCRAWNDDVAAWNLWVTALWRCSRAGQPLPEDVFSYHTVACERPAPVRRSLFFGGDSPRGGRPQRKAYIEPLAATLRHPHYWCGTEALMMNTSYLVFPWAADFAYRRAFFFDAGATYFDDCLSWFMETYEKRGWTFSQIYAWEMKPINHTDYWLRVPDKYKHRLHFYNTPCSSGRGDAMNPLQMIQRVARPDDYVVFKLDIDNSEMEVSLVMQILESPLLISLIDEMFWENHVKGSPLQWVGWGNLDRLTGNCSDMAGSYRCFTRLREVGIRAHSWV